VENELKVKFKKAYELFSTEIEVMKKLKCKSVNINRMGKSAPFNIAIFYFVVQSIGWIIIYIFVLDSIQVQYELTTKNIVFIPALVFFFIEMGIFPNIFLRIIKIDVLLDEKSRKDLLSDGHFGNPEYKKYKHSEQLFS